MSTNKKYYWLRLKSDFFTDKRIKKLRNIAGGDTYTIIYLKMQLLSLQDEGFLYFENVEETFAEEIALEIDEDVENVKTVIAFLLRNDLLAEINDSVYELIETRECIGSETDSAKRTRKHREKKKLELEKKEKMLQCNTAVTKCNTEKEIEIEKKKEIEIDTQCKSLTNVKQELNTNNKNKEIYLKEDFEKLWQMYPNKKGKTNAYKAFVKAIKSGVSTEEIKQGIENYVRYIELEKVEQRYIKHGSTWFNQQCWNDDYTIKRQFTTRDIADKIDFSDVL